MLVREGESNPQGLLAQLDPKLHPRSRGIPSYGVALLYIRCLKPSQERPRAPCCSMVKDSLGQVRSKWTRVTRVRQRARHSPGPFSIMVASSAAKTLRRSRSPPDPGGRKRDGPSPGDSELEMFVRVISLEVIREADNAQHHFEWVAFRSFRIVSTRPTEVAFQLPAGFLLLPSQPFRYNLFFSATAFQQQHVQPVIDVLYAAWYVAVQQSFGGAALSNIPDVAQAQVQAAAQAAYPGFVGHMAHVNAFAQLNQQFYWNPGWYRLSMRIETTSPERTVTKRWRFQLTQAQSNSLRGNGLKVVQEVCSQYIGQYYFANAPYLPPAA